MVLRWTPAALRDLEAAGDFIRTQNVRAAARIAVRIEEAVLHLEEHPALGREGRMRGTREIVVSATPFVNVYRVRSTEVQILRVLHHARKWP